MVTPVRILLSNATGIYAGGEEYVLTLGRWLARRGHQVWVSALPGHLLLTKCASYGIPTVPIGYEGMSRVFAVSRELRTHLRALAIDVVHSNANYDRTCAAFASAGLRTRHVAGVHSTHSIQHNVTHWWRNRFGTDHFITDADAGREVLIREDGISPRRITAVPIGIENETPAFHAGARETIRRHWGIGPSTIVIGNVARLVEFKGHRHLLDAIAIVVREHPDILVPIIGDGELDGPLRAQAQALGLGDRIRFLGFRDHLEAIYPGFDIYVHSSLELASEMFPIAILHALGTGLPVVCTNVGGISAMVRDGESGFLLPPADAGALAAGLLRVIRDPALRARMGQSSLRLFEERYHASAMVERVEQVYHHVCRTAAANHADSLSPA
jgi:glycosyltransferase involved in cell wall biosynthesis